jgi:glycosyltransferase involved in cell wall biosynthesis
LSRSRLRVEIINTKGNKGVEVAVIIPCFNSEKWIRAAVESVLAQTLPPAEIIVVNDGSTDSSADVLGRFGSRIRVITQVNQGLGAARNTGVRLSSAPWLSFLDADDQYEPDYLSQMECLAAAFPDATMLFSEYSNMERPDLPSMIDKYVPELRSLAAAVNDQFLYFDRRIDNVLIRSNGAFAPSTLTVRRDVFQIAGGFFDGIKGAEDLDFYVHALPHARVAIAKRKLVRKLFHATSLGHDQSVMRPTVEIFWNRAQRVCREQNPQLLPVVRDKYIGLLNGSAQSEVAQCRYEDAYASYSQLVRVEPWQYKNWKNLVVTAVRRRTAPRRM